MGTLRTSHVCGRYSKSNCLNVWCGVVWCVCVGVCASVVCVYVFVLVCDVIIYMITT